MAAKIKSMGHIFSAGNSTLFCFLLLSLFFSSVVHAAGVPTIGASYAAQISLTNVSISPLTPATNSSVNMYFTLLNTGNLASGNITLTVFINGPQNYSSSSSYFVPALSPMQSEDITLTMADAGPYVGVYNVDYITAYQVNGTVHFSNTSTASYEMSPSSTSPTSANMTSGISSLPQLTIEQVPIYTSLAVGSSAMVQLGIKNPTRSPETVNLSVASNFAKMMSLSTSSVYLGANSSALVNMLFRPSATLAGDTYAIPLTIAVTEANGSVLSATEFLTFSIDNEISMPNAYEQIQLINLSQISATLAVVNPTNTTLRNVLLYDYFPDNMVTDVSQISTSGIQAKVSSQNATARIAWEVGTLVPHLTAYGYYRISDSSNLGALAKRSSLLLVSPSQPSQEDILRVGNIAIPAFDTNSTGILNISMLYTGTSKQQITLFVNTPQGITAINQPQTINVTPNQLLNRKLFIQTGAAAGTFMTTLYILTANANYTYYLPLVVSAKQQSSNVIAPPGLISGTNITAQIDGFVRSLKYASTTIFLIVVLAIVIYVLNRHASTAKYDKRRAERLKEIRDSIDRLGG
jgi:hypothetical protein